MSKKKSMLEQLVVEQGTREVIGKFGVFKVYAPDQEFNQFLYELLDQYADDDSSEIKDVELIRGAFILLTNINEIDENLSTKENFTILLERGKREFRKALDCISEIVDEEATKIYKKIERINRMPEAAQKAYLKKLNTGN